MTHEYVKCYIEHLFKFEESNERFNFMVNELNLSEEKTSVLKIPMQNQSNSERHGYQNSPIYAVRLPSNTDSRRTI